MLVLAACAADDYSPPLERRFAARPAAIVASAELPDLCFDSLDYAVTWWRGEGATFTLEGADPTDPTLNGVPVSGEIGVLPGHLSVGVRGETRVALTVGGNIDFAEITLAECDRLSVAHELGHALGLEHVFFRNLMYPSLDEAEWTLTEEQRRWCSDSYPD